MTLNANGNPNAAWIIKTGSTLVTASTSAVVLIGGANPCNSDNITWRIGSSATLGSSTSFLGNILASASVTLNTGVGIAMVPAITLGAVQSTSTTTCAGSSGSTTIAYLNVGTTVVIAQPTNIAPNTVVNVGIVKLVLNEQIAFSTPDDGLTVNAVHVTVNVLGLVTANVVVASSESDIGNCT